MSYSPTPANHRDDLVADMDWLTPDLAVGGDLSSEYLEASRQAEGLDQQGVTDIIDRRGEHSDELIVGWPEWVKGIEKCV